MILDTNLLFTTHLIVGAAVGVASENPILGFGTSFIVHHAIDALPHFDQGSFYTLKSGAAYLGKNREEIPRSSFLKRDWIMLFIDFAVGGTALLFLLWKLPVELWTPLASGVFGGLLPDIIDSSPLWSKKLRAKARAIFHYHRFHIFFHWTVAKREAVLGFATQATLIAVSLWYLLS